MCTANRPSRAAQAVTATTSTLHGPAGQFWAPRSRTHASLGPKGLLTATCSVPYLRILKPNSDACPPPIRGRSACNRPPFEAQRPDGGRPQGAAEQIQAIIDGVQHPELEFDELDVGHG